MTIDQYYELDELERHETLRDHGAMIGEREDAEHRIVLYQVFSFYVELYYHLRSNALRKLIAFDDMEGLDVYINQFKLKI